ncbi:thymidylate kinase [Heterostelium album PN500]|uniref:Thymidylate kinase n=1 Tax=Heterostelium pallidum (strain ATCC 26659 / Pp 5 / PN500) TaxID=670386 RepID=D3B3D8_HETP5|nr:thymidylate kinase [Heterostelium album PN500]EFA83836.1 thymidylate kinase [Heterostelium album PN500]|eukprot:XP_020435953.1 thymidylate kinase [Heterostelium album PN500]
MDSEHKTTETTEMKRGIFILFEGADRVGKSTQVQSLFGHLSTTLGLPTKQLRFPDRTTQTGTIINSYLQNSTQLDDRALHLLFSANRWESKDTLLKHLNEGNSLVVDRYSYSGVAYSAAKGIDFDWCFGCEKGLPAPDLIFYLKMDTEDATKRGDYGNERYEKVDFQKKIKEVYESKLVNSSWNVINANRPIEEVSKEINEIVDRSIKNGIQNKPIQCI